MATLSASQKLTTRLTAAMPAMPATTSGQMSSRIVGSTMVAAMPVLAVEKATWRMSRGCR
jgi:hypothetical protein